MGLLQNGLFSEIAMVPNDSNAPFLARRGGAERHEDSKNGADGAFCKKGDVRTTAEIRSLRNQAALESNHRLHH